MTRQPSLWLFLWAWACLRPLAGFAQTGPPVSLLGETPDAGLVDRKKPGQDGTWDGKEDPFAFPPFASWSKGVSAFKIRYWSSGLPITGFILRPTRAPDKETPRRLPLIIANRGGYGRKVGAWDGLSLAGLAYLVQKVPAIVLASQYRGSSTQPSDERDHDGYMGADLQDVICLDKLARSIDGVDADRIGMYGFSRGGGMTFNAWPHMPHVLGVVTVGGLVDFEDWIAYLEALHKTAKGGRIVIAGQPFIPERILEECRTAIAKDLYLADKVRFKSPSEVTDDTFRAALRNRSPILPKNLEAIAKRGPILLMHGGQDRNNPVRQAMKMQQALQEKGADVEMMIIEDAGHMMIGEGADDRMDSGRGREILGASTKRIADFFRTKVFGGSNTTER